MSRWAGYPSGRQLSKPSKQKSSSGSWSSCVELSKRSDIYGMPVVRHEPCLGVCIPTQMCLDRSLLPLYCVLACSCLVPGPGETEIGECAHSASHSTKALKWLLLPSPCLVQRTQQKMDFLPWGSRSQICPLSDSCRPRTLQEAWGHCLEGAELSPSQPVSHGDEVKPESQGEDWGGAWLTCPLLGGLVGHLVDQRRGILVGRALWEG